MLALRLAYPYSYENSGSELWAVQTLISWSTPGQYMNNSYAIGALCLVSTGTGDYSNLSLNNDSKADHLYATGLDFDT